MFDQISLAKLDNYEKLSDTVAPTIHQADVSPGWNRQSERDAADFLVFTREWAFDELVLDVPCWQREVIEPRTFLAQGEHTAVD